MFCKTVHFSETSDLQSSLAQVQNLTPRLQYPQCTAPLGSRFGSVMMVADSVGSSHRARYEERVVEAG